MQHLSLYLSIAALVVSLASGGVTAWLLRRVNRYQADINRIANTRGAAPTDELIRHWKVQQNKYPPGSPKHIAYTNRLKSVGH